MIIPGVWGIVKLYPAFSDKGILYPLIAVLVIAAITSALAAFTWYYITRRILALGRIIRGVSGGDYISKAAVNSDDEIGEFGNEINSMIDGLRERFMFSRFVSRTALEQAKGDLDIDPAGEKRNLTVLFSDIINFNEYAESRNPETVFEMLNTVMSIQARIIHKNGGEIQKYCGHEIMAVFGGRNMVYRAARSAEEIRCEIKKINETSVTPVYAGFGINTGDMLAGNMGSAGREDRVVVGSAVNTGARLCAAAGRNTIVLSERSQGYISGRGEFIEHEPLKVRGSDKPVRIFTLVKLA